MNQKLKWMLTSVVLTAFNLPVSAGYISTLPSGEDNAPDKIYKTENVTGPMQTSDWWSSIVKN